MRDLTVTLPSMAWARIRQELQSPTTYRAEHHVDAIKTITEALEGDESPLVWALACEHGIPNFRTCGTCDR